MSSVNLLTKTPVLERAVPNPPAAKRRKIIREEPQAWKDLQNLKFKEYQITPNQQTILNSDSSWFHPGNAEDFPNGVENVETAVPVEEAVNGGHPPLSSPEPEEEITRDDSQFYTQVPPMMAESQVRQLQRDGKTIDGDVEHEAIAEEEEPAASSDVEPIEWEESPPRPKRVF
jgi:hypothetical protein